MESKLSEGDRLDIADVVIRYATGIDRRDWALFRTCFTEDCDVDYGDIGAWRGAEDFTRYNEDAHQTLGATMHRITNIVIEDDGIHGVANGRAYVDAVFYSKDGQYRGYARGFYDDTFTQEGGIWKIDKRRFTTVEIATSLSGEVAGSSA
jgi:hypothetical protein